MPAYPFVDRARSRGTAAVLALVFTAGCLGTSDRSSDGPAAMEEAVELWAHPDTVGIAVRTPIDLDLASRDVAWALDGTARAVLRYEPNAGEFGMLGLADRPPAEVVEPVRLAVSADHGIFVYDDSTGLVGLFTPSGQHIRSFDPGLRPAILEASRRPLRLTFGVQDVEADSLPHLTVIQTDFRGESPDTLLDQSHGPVPLRSVVAATGSLATTASASGLWIYAREVPDTVFEIAAGGRGRRLVLPEADSKRLGIAADVEQEIVWVVAPSATGGVDYEAYDVSGVEPGGLIDGAAAYLGARTTPEGFGPKVAHDGVVAGWFRSPRGVFLPMAYDMRVEDLRAGAEAARAGRAGRRAAIEAEWRRLIETAAARQAASGGEERGTGDAEGQGEGDVDDESDGGGAAIE